MSQGALLIRSVLGDLAVSYGADPAGSVFFFKSHLVFYPGTGREIHATATSAPMGLAIFGMFYSVPK